MDLIEELTWRGMIHDSIPGTEEFLADNQAVVYVGFDPTAPSLGIGNLVPLMLLVHFQRHGHKPIALVGGATGMVGDPSGKSKERNLLNKEELNRNQEGFRKQLEFFLDFDCGANSAMILNNFDWFKDMGFLEFLRDVGKHLSINYMMAKDSVKSRLETGISFTEFSYQLLQGYDFYYMNKHYGVNMQAGGSDQWGNITTGTELIGRMGGSDCYALTCPLITKADGTKFGKTERGNIFLDASMTSPYLFYQFWRDSSDADIVTLAKIFSLRPVEELKELIANHDQNPNNLKTLMAEEMTSRVHGQEALDQALETSAFLFEKTVDSVQGFSEEKVQRIFESLEGCRISRSDVEGGVTAVELAVQAGLYPSNSEARRRIKQKGFKLNKKAVNHHEQPVTFEDLLRDGFLLLSNGKKQHHAVIVD